MLTVYLTRSFFRQARASMTFFVLMTSQKGIASKIRPNSSFGMMNSTMWKSAGLRGLFQGRMTLGRWGVRWRAATGGLYVSVKCRFCRGSLGIQSSWMYSCPGSSSCSHVSSATMTGERALVRILMVPSSWSPTSCDRESWVVLMGTESRRLLPTWIMTMFWAETFAMEVVMTMTERLSARATMTRAPGRSSASVLGSDSGEVAENSDLIAEEGSGP